MRRRTSAAAAVVVVALGATAGCGSDSSHTTSPTGVAEQWANGEIHHDDVASLQCRPVIHTEIDTIPMTVSKLTGVHAVRSSEPSGGTWKVTLQTEPSEGGTTFGVTVVKQHGSYVVCD